MLEDPAAAAGTAAGEGAAGTTDPAPVPGAPGAADTRTPEEILADAASGAGDDPARQLAAAQADARKWRDLSRQNETRAKANAAAADELQRLKDAEKTEIQRATDAATAAEERAAAAEALYHRTLAAATYGLPPELIGSIAGSTEDESAASAEKLAAAINQRVADQVAAASASAGSGAAPQSGRSQRPVESLRPGGMPASGSPTTPDEWIRSGWNR